jgi:hypothetical protein
VKSTSSPIYRWRAGEVEITRVLEFEAALFEPTALYPEVTPKIVERHRSWLEPMLMDPTSGQLVFAFHSALIKTPRATVLVDTCSGNDKERPHKLRYHKKSWPYLAMCCARICTPITSVGTHASSTADGCRHSQTPATYSLAKNGITGG